MFNRSTQYTNMDSISTGEILLNFMYQYKEEIGIKKRNSKQKRLLSTYIVIAMLISIMSYNTVLTVGAKENSKFPLEKIEQRAVDNLYSNLPTIDVTESGTNSEEYKAVVSQYASIFKSEDPEATIAMIGTKNEDALGKTIITLNDEERKNYSVRNYYTWNGVRMIKVTSNCKKSNDKAYYVLHGGAAVMGFNWTTHGHLLKSLADKGYTVYALDYHTVVDKTWNGKSYNYKDMLREAVCGYIAVLAEYRSKSIVVSGDSYGGTMALALAQILKKMNIEQPEAYTLMSPWTNLTGDTYSYVANKDVDPMLGSKLLTVCADMYADGEDKKNPLISPYYGDYAGIDSRFLFTTSTTEILESDSIDTAMLLQSEGKDVQLYIFRDVMHDAPVFAGIGVYELDKAFEYVLGYIDQLSTQGERRSIGNCIMDIDTMLKVMISLK